VKFYSVVHRITPCSQCKTDFTKFEEYFTHSKKRATLFPE